MKVLKIDADYKTVSLSKSYFMVEATAIYKNFSEIVYIFFLQEISSDVNYFA